MAQRPSTPHNPTSPPQSPTSHPPNTPRNPQFAAKYLVSSPHQPAKHQPLQPITTPPTRRHSPTPDNTNHYPPTQPAPPLQHCTPLNSAPSLTAGLVRARRPSPPRPAANGVSGSAPLPAPADVTPLHSHSLRTPSLGRLGRGPPPLAASPGGRRRLGLGSPSCAGLVQHHCVRTSPPSRPPVTVPSPIPIAGCGYSAAGPAGTASCTAAGRPGRVLAFTSAAPAGTDPPPFRNCPGPAGLAKLPAVSHPPVAPRGGGPGTGGPARTLHSRPRPLVWPRRKARVAPPRCAPGGPTLPPRAAARGRLWGGGYGPPPAPCRPTAGPLRDSGYARPLPGVFPILLRAGPIHVLLRCTRRG
jgi:hypothetical protein